MEPIYYPRLIKRIQAIFIDSFIIVAGVYAIVFLVPWTPQFPPLRGLLLVAVIIVSEPLLVTLTGGSIGHHVIGIRVTRLSGTGNINFFASIIRFIIKTLLGWFSLAMVLVTRRHQGLHDLLVGSLVVYKSAAGLPASEKLSNREEQKDLYVMPSRWRRIAITTAYCIASFVAYAFGLLWIVSSTCARGGSCSHLEASIDVDVQLLWLTVVGVLMVLGYKGLLFGARRRKRES